MYRFEQQVHQMKHLRYKTRRDRWVRAVQPWRRGGSTSLFAPPVTTPASSVQRLMLSPSVIMVLHNEAAVVALEAGVAADHTLARRVSPRRTTKTSSSPGQKVYKSKQKRAVPSREMIKAWVKHVPSQRVKTREHRSRIDFPANFRVFHPRLVILELISPARASIDFFWR